MRTISVSVDDKTHRLARIKAAKTGTTVSAMMRDLLTALLQHPAEAEPVETEPQRRARLLDEVLERCKREGVGVDTGKILNRKRCTRGIQLADTNVLIYAVSDRDADAPKRTQAETTLKEPDLALSVQVLQEFYYQATRPQGPAGLTHEQAMEFLQPFRSLPTQEITVELFNRATETKQKFGLSYWDAAISAAAKMLGCEAVYSEDLSHQEDYDGLRVLNPFSDGN